jgi:hypothetical protein
MQAISVEDDSTGKGKFQDAQNRTKALTAAFVVGLCIGLVISERLYISTNAPPAVQPGSQQQGTASNVVLGATQGTNPAAGKAAAKRSRGTSMADLERCVALERLTSFDLGWPAQRAATAVHQASRIG